MSQSNQLTNVKNYDVNNIVFSAPIVSNIPDSTFSYRRILLSTRNKNGSLSDLILPTETCFSFGVSENRDPKTKELNGHVMPICLWSKDSPTEMEKAWTDTFNNICAKCVDHVLQSKEELGKWDLDKSDLKKFNPLYWKRDKVTGKIEKGAGPTLYAKLIETKADGGKILSLFYDRNNGDELDPLQLMGKYCHVNATIKIESIFIGSRISLQVKLWEAAVNLHEKGITRLLQFKSPTPTRNLPTLTIDTSRDDESAGSISDDEPSP
jgi:hypothetical protein